MTLWELKFIYSAIRQHGYAGPMLDVGGVFSTTVAAYNPDRAIPTTSGHIWSEISHECDSSHSVEESATGDKRYGTIVSSSTLEHCRDPVGFLRSIKTLLHDGGVMILTAPFMWTQHGDPSHDLWRFSPAGLAELCDRSGLTKVDVGLEKITDGREMSWLVASNGEIRDRAATDAIPPIEEHHAF